MVKVEVRDGLDEHGNEEEDDAPAADTLDDVITVEIKVRDVNETPVAPKVTVTSPAVAADATEATLVVTWNKPDNTGPRHRWLRGGVQWRRNYFHQPVSPAHFLSLTDDEVSYTIDRPHAEQFLSSSGAREERRRLGHVVHSGKPVDQRGG